MERSSSGSRRGRWRLADLAMGQWWRSLPKQEILLGWPAPPPVRLPGRNRFPRPSLRSPHRRPQGPCFAARRMSGRTHPGRRRAARSGPSRRETGRNKHSALQNPPEPRNKRGAPLKALIPDYVISRQERSKEAHSPYAGFVVWGRADVQRSHAIFTGCRAAATASSSPLAASRPLLRPSALSLR